MNATATKTASMTAERAFAEVQAKAEQIKNDERAVIGTVSPGDVIRQGDIYLVALKRLPTGKLTSERQLAPGNTQGSRHILTGACEVYQCDPDAMIAAVRKVLPGAELYRVLMGPGVKALKECELTHPEHGDRLLPDGECFAVVYQRAFAEEVRRQMD